MTRPLPNCANCGTPLKKAGGRCVLIFGTPGRPHVGWCDQCDWGSKDPEFLRLKVGEMKVGENNPGDGIVAASVLAAIQARGPGRVTWSKRR